MGVETSVEWLGNWQVYLYSILNHLKQVHQLEILLQVLELVNIIHLIEVHQSSSAHGVTPVDHTWRKIEILHVELWHWSHGVHSVNRAYRHIKAEVLEFSLHLLLEYLLY